MRKLLAVAAIVLAGLGVLWLVRLSGRPSDTPPSTAAATGNDSSSALRPDAQRERLAEKPPRVLGRIGGALPETLVDPRLLIEKSRRTLTVFSDERPVKTYRIALGPQWEGDKEREGDGRTPEGEFYICSKNPKSKFNLSLGLSYPNAEDAERGLAQHLITTREHRTIIEAIRSYRQPPWTTKLGGEIMIHGGGTQRDWTIGCAALDDADIEELYNRLPTGTSVVIRP